MIKDVNINNGSLLPKGGSIPHLHGSFAQGIRKGGHSGGCCGLTSSRDRARALLAIASFVVPYLGSEARNRFLGHLPETAIARAKCAQWHS
jgi:hypothetical protein